MRFRILASNDRQLKSFDREPHYTRIEEFEATGKSRLTLVEAEHNLREAGVLEPGFEVVLIEQVAE